MPISLSKESDVSLREQLAEQIVFLITTGEFRAGQQMPSVRALGRRMKIHHNTVSEAYKELVRRQWLTRKRGSKLVVGTKFAGGEKSPGSLDELINETIQRAKGMGFSLQALTECVRSRLLAQPADHFLVVEPEPGLREIIRHEIQENLGWSVAGCTPEEIAKEPNLAVGAQVFAPNHIIAELREVVQQKRPALSIVYSRAEEQLDLIRSLKKPSMIAVVSVSESLLKTARSLLAPAVGRRHTFRDFLLPLDGRLELRAIDMAFCDSVTMAAVKCRRKIRYPLVDPKCLAHLARAVDRVSEKS
jgi:GntR family transcriptional regulator